MNRTILHCDMNNFYASVECFLDPKLKPFPVAVCGDVEERHGIVLAKNYKAKGYGVSTGEAIWQAKQKCPGLVVVPPHYEEYMKFSKAAREIYEHYTDQVEPFGMDECWLDVTGSTRIMGACHSYQDRPCVQVRRRLYRYRSQDHHRRWVPDDIVQDFVFGLLGTPSWARWNMSIKYIPQTAQWVITNKAHDKTNVKANTVYGTSRVNAYEIIEDTLNLKDVRVFDYVDDGSGKPKPVLNKHETTIAQGKQEEIKRAFEDWVWQDPERREELCKLYNEKFNSTRPREYDGSHIKYQAVKPGFIDKNGLFPLISVKDHSFCPVFRCYMAVNISTTVLVPEVVRHIFSNKPGNSVLRDKGTDTPELLILKYLHPVFHIFSSFLIQPAPAAWW